MNTALMLNTTRNQILSHIPKKETCQRMLLVTLVGCSILAIIPPIRIGAAIAMRSLVLISSLASFTSIDKKNPISAIAQNVSRITIIILGIAALATASPALLTASIVMDLAMQSFLCIKALYNREYKTAALHFGMVVIDTLAVAALVTGSWQLMFAAGAASLVAMVSIALAICVYTKQKDLGSKIDIACYLALTVTGCVGIAQMVPTIENRVKGVQFKMQGDVNGNKNIQHYYYDKDGNQLAYLRAGQEQDITLSPDKTFNGNLDDNYIDYGRSFHRPLGGTFIYEQEIVAPPVVSSAALLPISTLGECGVSALDRIGASHRKGPYTELQIEDDQTATL